MSNFKTSSRLSLTLYGTGQVCLGVGWYSDPASMTFTTQYFLQDCYKRILDDISNWSSTFYGKSALFIDNCSPSNSGGLITLYTWAIASGISNYVLGGQTPNGPGCIAFA
jgi:hypothetical protein